MASDLTPDQKIVADRRGWSLGETLGLTGIFTPQDFWGKTKPSPNGAASPKKMGSSQSLSWRPTADDSGHEIGAWKTYM